MNSTHKVEVVPVELKAHPNADSLSIVQVFGYTVCVRTEDWKNKDKGAYVPPDSIVDTTRPEFSFLSTEGLPIRITVKKLRGVVSMGMLVPAPEESVIGDDVAEQLGVQHYEPCIKLGFNTDNTSPPKGHYPKYDVDSIFRYSNLFTEGEPVHVTEKIHGANARYVYSDGMMYCGSRTNWKKEDDKSVWWIAYRNHPEIGEFCRWNEGVALYGEVYGQVQNLKYGENTAKFVAFDIFKYGQWLSAMDAVNLFYEYNIPEVPSIETYYPFNLENLKELAEQDSRMPKANHYSEGVVVKPMIERTAKIGRVQLKLVSNRYLSGG